MKNPKRNYGFGRNLKFAAKQSLKKYLGARFSTIASHCNRFNLFADFCKKNKTNNSIYITQDLFDLYANSIQKRILRGDLSTSYAHNLISSVSPLN